MISIRRISLGGGYRYLMESVAGRSNDLSRYYASSGTPPGVFLGAGLADLDGGRGVEPGSEVTEKHLEAMLAGCTDPITSEPVGGTPKARRGGLPVAGFDLTFSPPKSVSVAWALADEGTKAVIYECHRRSGDVNGVAAVQGNTAGEPPLHLQADQQPREALHPTLPGQSAVRKRADSGRSTVMAFNGT